MRNNIAHVGFGRDALRAQRITEKAQEYFAEVESIWHNKEAWLAPFPRQAADYHVLLTPFGLATGLLNTVVTRVDADERIVVTSKEGRALADGALKRAGATEGTRFVVVNDPFSGFAECSTVIKQVREFFAVQLPSQITLNITGGTTALQYIVQQVGLWARGHGVKVRTEAAVDRRPPAEQKRDPDKIGEVVSIDQVSEYGLEEDEEY